MTLQETYNRIAKDWHRDHQADDWWVEGTEKFIQLLPENAAVLDAGCAGGVKSRFLAARGLRVIGVDFSEQFIEIARREVPEGRFFIWDLRQIDEFPECFDGILLQAVLLHFPKAEVPDILRKLADRLEAGGLLYVAVKAIREDRVEENVLREDDYGYPYERFFSYYGREELAELLADAGFKTIHEDVSSSGRTEWIQIIGKKKA